MRVLYWEMNHFVASHFHLIVNKWSNIFNNRCANDDYVLDINQWFPKLIIQSRIPLIEYTSYTLRHDSHLFLNTHSAVKSTTALLEVVLKIEDPITCSVKMYNYKSRPQQNTKIAH